MFQQYPQNDVNEPILLHQGSFRVGAGDRYIEASGSAHLRWLPSPGVVFDIETAEPCPEVDPASIAIELRGFTTSNVLSYSISMDLTRIRASAGAMEWGGDQGVLSVGFQIVNLTDFITPGPSAVPGDPTAAGNVKHGETIQTAKLKHDVWQVSIVAVRASGDRYKRLIATGGYAFTHVGQLTRIDGTAFTVEHAKDVLETLRVFLSFARGAACHLPIQWGRGDYGEIVWRQFGSPVVDAWKRGYASWFSKHHGGVLAELFGPFCRSYEDPELREPLGLALHWYRRCNTQSSGLEGSLVLGMAALDVLGALVVVDSIGAMKDTEYNDLPAAKKLRKLLSALKIPANVPPRYEALSRFAKKHGNLDSCGALTQLRNGFVHATKERRRVVFGPAGEAATFNAWQLSLWYQELALLRVLDYRGSYSNRTTAVWDWDVEPVPWNASTSG